MKTAVGFTLWTVEGAGLALGLLTVLTIGVFVLPMAIALGAVLAWRGPRWLAGPGIVAGLSLPLLYVGYLNRGGPGMVCTGQTPLQRVAPVAASGSCTQEWSPWPWIGTGLLLIVAGVVLALAAARRWQSARPRL
jgi:hypothetical protein